MLFLDGTGPTLRMADEGIADEALQSSRSV